MFDINGPFSLTFGMTLHDVPEPTFLMRRAGGLKELRDYHGEQHIKVLILAGKDPFRTNWAQRQSVERLCRVVLFLRPSCEIVFCVGTSPWSELSRATILDSIHALMWKPWRRMVS